MADRRDDNDVAGAQPSGPNPTTGELSDEVKAAIEKAIQDAKHDVRQFAQETIAAESLRRITELKAEYAAIHSELDAMCKATADEVNGISTRVRRVRRFVPVFLMEIRHLHRQMHVLREMLIALGQAATPQHFASPQDANGGGH